MPYIDLECDVETCRLCGCGITIDKGPPDSQRVALENEGWRPFGVHWQCPDCAEEPSRVERSNRIAERLDRQWQTKEALEGRR